MLDTEQESTSYFPDALRVGSTKEHIFIETGHRKTESSAEIVPSFKIHIEPQNVNELIYRLIASAVEFEQETGLNLHLGENPTEESGDNE